MYDYTPSDTPQDQKLHCLSAPQQKFYGTGIPLSLVCRWTKSHSIAEASGPKTPDVSIAMGQDKCVHAMVSYLVIFFCSAKATTAPASDVACSLYEVANVSGHVTSQTSGRPDFLVIL